MGLIHLPGNRGLLMWFLRASVCGTLGTIFIYCGSVLHKTTNLDDGKGLLHKPAQYSLLGKKKAESAQDTNSFREIKGSSQYFDNAAFPMTPVEAISLFGDKLPWWERYEMLHYKKVWFLGLAANKTQLSEDPQNNYGFDSELDWRKRSHYGMVVGDHIAYRYEIVKDLGFGAWGLTVLARDWADPVGISVALKVMYIESSPVWNGTYTREIEIMNTIEKNAKNLDYFSRLLANFEFRNHQCLVFELLGSRMDTYVGSNMVLFRQFAEDILLGMYYLHDMRIIHYDMHQENLMYIHGKSNKSSGQLLKIMDFGYSVIQDDKRYNWEPTFQVRRYRAPEVVLQLPHTTQIDMWSVGIIFVELFLGFGPYPGGKNNTELLAYMIEVFGPPPMDLLLRSNKESYYEEVTLYAAENRIHRQPLQKLLEKMDPTLFELVSRLLEYDPKTRLTAEQALRHPFITGIATA